MDFCNLWIALWIDSWIWNYGKKKSLLEKDTMKIKIDKDETYNIEFPENMEMPEFSALVDRLMIIRKIFWKPVNPTMILQSEPALPREYKPRHSNRIRVGSDRNKAIEIVRAYYEVDGEEKYNEMLKLYDNDRNALSKQVNALKTKRKITPEEVGMIRFPTIHERRPGFKFLKKQ